MYVTLISLTLLVAATTILYNRLVRCRNRVNTAWSDIDVQLHSDVTVAIKVMVVPEYPAASEHALTERESCG